MNPALDRLVILLHGVDSRLRDLVPIARSWAPLLAEAISAPNASSAFDSGAIGNWERGSGML